MSKLIGSKLKILIVIVAVLVVLIAGGVLVYINGIGAVDTGDKKTVNVNIPNGSAGTSIVEILDENGLIKNKTCAKIHVRLGGYDSLQANTYVFSKAMTLPEMMKAMNTGDFKYLAKSQFTIVEGATVPQAAEAIAEAIPATSEDIQKVWSDKKYLKTLIKKYWFLTDDILQKDIMFPLEGYLYPETYFVMDADPTIESITEQILKKTDEELSKRKNAIAKSGRTVHQFLSLASVVESESLFDKDRPKIAGVFINRLNADMPLQSDITVLYALQEKRVDVTYADLEVDSKYNTYKNKGLPIGPVCSVPGSTMDDVLNYEKSDYLYFFATEDGKVIYSKTSSEHEKAVDNHLWY